MPPLLVMLSDCTGGALPPAYAKVSVLGDTISVLVVTVSVTGTITGPLPALVAVKVIVPL
jgi:hypothetical protein